MKYSSGSREHAGRLPQQPITHGNSGAHGHPQWRESRALEYPRRDSVEESDSPGLPLTTLEASRHALLIFVK